MANLFRWLADHSPVVAEALLHSCWISAAIGLMVWVALRLVSVRHSDLRYGIALAGLLLTVVGTFAATSSVHRFRLQASSQHSDLAAADAALSKLAVSDFESRKVTPTTATQHGRLSASKVSGTNEADVSHDTQPMNAGSATAVVQRSANSNQAAALSESGAAADQGVYPRTEDTEVHVWQWHDISRWLVVLWVIGMAFMVLRTLNSLLGLRQLQRSPADGQSAPLGELQVITNQLCERMNLRHSVKLVMNANTTYPAVLGFLKPIILIPPAMMTGVSPEHWQLIIAHELSHVRRYDAIVNLMQMLIESVLFFNPGVWWISRQVRIEREACCDAMAADVTGQTLEFARMLLNVASGDWRPTVPKTSRAKDSRPESLPSPALAMYLADETEPGSVRDRVTRLADPNRKSAPRFTRMGLAVALLALVGTAFALQQGTDFAVQKVADLMTPVQRVNTLARLQALHSGVYVKAGAADGEELAEATTGVNDDSARPEPKFEIKINVRTEDGQPVPKKLRIASTYSARKNSTSSYSGSGTVVAGIDEGQAVYETSMKLPHCQFVIGGSAPGYAPFAIAPRTVYEEADAAPIEIILTKGFVATIVVLGEDGKPLPGAKLSGGSLVKLDGSGGSSSNTLKLTSDSEGIIQLADCGNVPYSLRLRSEGHQHESFEVSLKADVPTKLTLKKARPTVLQIVDDATGEPVAGAVCVEQQRERKSTQDSGSMLSGDPREQQRRDWLILSESTEDGVMNVDQMRDDMLYTVGIMAKGYGTYGIGDLEAGAAERVVRLRKPINVAGRISGDLSRMQKDRKSSQKFKLRYQNPLGGTSTQWADFLSATVESDGSFELNDVVPGIVKFQTPISASTQRFEISKSVDDVELRITEPAAETTPNIANLPMRDVVLRLTGVTNDAPARGFLCVSWRGPTANTFQSAKDIPFVKNQVKVSVPVGVSIRYEAYGMVGYFVELGSQSADVVSRSGNASGPQIVEIPTEPAGAVHGQLIASDGQPAAAGFANVYPASVSWLTKWKGDARSLNPSSSSGGSKFFCSLPFGGTYVVLARMTTGDGLQWCCSKPFTIDGAHPIENIDLQLNPGKPVSVRLLRQNGKPISNAEVEVRVRVECDGVDGTSSFSLMAVTGTDGIATIASALPDSNVGPLTITAAVSVNGVSGCIGRSVSLDELSQRDDAYELQLASAVSASGILIDAASGRPVPNAKIRVYPRNFQTANFKGSIRTTTDAKGHFSFDSLEEIQYTGDVHGAAIIGTKITMLPGGGYQMRPPASGQTTLEIVGGVAEPVQWKVELVPGQGLNPLPE